MASTKPRQLQALEATPLAQGVRGVIECKPGQTPLQALEGVAPGTWLVLPDGMSRGLLGCVSPSGKRSILFGG